jgi:PIN domain nuclease of toxin-antitoxin system
MKLLLDTHALLWAQLAPQRLSKRVAPLLADGRNTIFVSAASAWEIATKVRLGKLPFAEVFEQEFLQIPQRTGYVLLPIDPETALRSGRLVGEHGDPFDRMIAAQALELDIEVISSDAKLDQFGVRRIW